MPRHTDDIIIKHSASWRHWGIGIKGSVIGLRMQRALALNIAGFDSFQRITIRGPAPETHSQSTLIGYSYHKFQLIYFSFTLSPTYRSPFPNMSTATDSIDHEWPSNKIVIFAAPNPTSKYEKIRLNSLTQGRKVGIDLTADIVKLKLLRAYLIRDQALRDCGGPNTGEAESMEWLHQEFFSQGGTDSEEDGIVWDFRTCVNLEAMEAEASIERANMQRELSAGYASHRSRSRSDEAPEVSKHGSESKAAFNTSSTSRSKKVSKGETDALKSSLPSSNSDSRARRGEARSTSTRNGKGWQCKAASSGR